jgi:signal transduction histidine kinase
MERILEIGRELTSTVSLEHLLHKIVAAAAELTGSETAAILLSTNQSNELRFVAAHQFNDRLVDIPVPIDRSVAGVCFTSGEPVIVQDAQSDPRYYPVADEATGLKAHSLLAVPLQFKTRRIGVLEAENKKPDRTFSPEDVETLTALASQATVAIENARLVKTLQGAHDLAQALRQAGVALSSTLHFDEVLDRLLAEVNRVVPYDAANVMLLEEDTVRVFRGRGYEQRDTLTKLRTIHLKLSDVPGLEEMRQTRQPLVVPMVTESDDWIHLTSEQAWIKSYIGVPITIREETMGFLNVLSAKPDFFKPGDAERMQAFASHAAIAIENARLYHQAQQELDRRMQTEEELRQHRDQLEEIIEDRTLDLTTANLQLKQEINERARIEQALREYAVELEAQNEELDAFAHTVAHDIKGPLNVMTGYAHLLEAGLDHMSPAQAKESTLAISRAGQKMTNIINALLLLARVRREEVETEPLHMGAIVSEAVQRLNPQIEESQAELSLPDRWPRAMGVAPWVEEIWVNYLSNAIKYGGRPPKIELGASIEDNGFIQFYVRDNGPGLSTKEQARLFTPFTRLHQVQAEGHGLGLSIVERIVYKLGGEVGVESSGFPGQGSTFYFTLPAASAEEER